MNTLIAVPSTFPGGLESPISAIATCTPWLPWKTVLLPR